MIGKNYTPVDREWNEVEEEMYNMYRTHFMYETSYGHNFGSCLFLRDELPAYVFY